MVLAAPASAQTPVNIVYPIAEWGFDAGPAVGAATFYDQISVQFVHKLPGGTHIFWVKSDCGDSRVRFAIGN